MTSDRSLRPIYNGFVTVTLSPSDAAFIVGYHPAVLGDDADTWLALELNARLRRADNYLPDLPFSLSLRGTARVGDDYRTTITVDVTPAPDAPDAVTPRTVARRVAEHLFHEVMAEAMLGYSLRDFAGR